MTPYRKPLLWGVPLRRQPSNRRSPACTSRRFSESAHEMTKRLPRVLQIHLYLWRIIAWGGGGCQVASSPFHTFHKDFHSNTGISGIFTWNPAVPPVCRLRGGGGGMSFRDFAKTLLSSPHYLCYNILYCSSTARPRRRRAKKRGESLSCTRSCPG